jgi:hypothetical protein
MLNASKKALFSICFLAATLLLAGPTASAETLHLKSGRAVKGEIVNETDSCVKVMIAGVPVTYYADEIVSIERAGKPAKKESFPNKSPDLSEGVPAVGLNFFLPAVPVLFMGQPEVTDEGKYLVYVPSGVDKAKRYPLVVVFSPGGDAEGSIALWREVADKYQWFVLASKEFRNGVDTDEIFPGLISDLEKRIFTSYPIDPKRVVASGMSGGGMASHLIIFEYADKFRAIIPNVGVIHPYCLENQVQYPIGKLAVFLASPTDSNYTAMLRDRQIVERFSWKTQWIEFEGGHITAPQWAYEKAAKWLDEQMKMDS